MKVALALVILFGSVSCRAIARRDLTANTRVGSIEIHASTRELASRTAAAVARARPIVEELPGVRCPERAVVYVREDAGSRFHGRTYSDLIDIELGRGCDTPDVLDYVVAHELTHYFILGAGDHGAAWHSLPTIVEEGLCEWIAQRCAPATADVLRARYTLVTGTLLSGSVRVDGPFSSAAMQDVDAVQLMSPSVDREALGDAPSWFDSSREALSDMEPPANREALTGLGFFLVRRIGVDGCWSLVEEARRRNQPTVPCARVVEAARLDFDRRGEWLCRADALADGGAYELLRQQALTMVVAADRKADRRMTPVLADPMQVSRASGVSSPNAVVTWFELVWEDSSGRVLATSRVGSDSQHGPVPTGAVVCRWTAVSTK